MSKDSTNRKCTKILDRQKCSTVASCYELDNNIDISNCAWCPMKGKAYVYDKEKLEKIKKTGGKIQYHPKYPKDDSCEYPKKFPWVGWTKTPLLKTTQQCNKVYQDHQCFNSKDDKGKALLKFKNTDGCKNQMWTDFGFYGKYKSHKNDMMKREDTKYEMQKIDKDINGSTNFGDMLNTMKILKEKGKNTTVESFVEGISSNEKFDKASKIAPILYNKEEDPCTWFEIKKKKNPTLKIPEKCKLKLWNESNCGIEGKYHPNNVRKKL